MNLTKRTLRDELAYHLLETSLTQSPASLIAHLEAVFAVRAEAVARRAVELTLEKAATLAEAHNTECARGECASHKAIRSLYAEAIARESLEGDL